MKILSLSLSLFQYSAPSHGGLTHSSQVSRISGGINGVVKNDGEASRCGAQVILEGVSRVKGCWISR